MTYRYTARLSMLMAVVFTFNSVFGGVRLPDPAFSSSALKTDLSRFMHVRGPVPEGPIVYVIRDIHSNEEAQRNIAAALDVLVRAYHAEPISIGIEGAHGPFDYAPFQTLPRQDAVRDIADQLLKENRIGALGFWGLTGRYRQTPGVHSRGIDDPALYRANVAAYRRAASHQANLEQRTLRLQRLLLREAAATLPSQARQMMHARFRFANGEIELPTYVRWLSRHVASAEVPVVARQYLQSLWFERQLDTTWLHDDRAHVLRFLLGYKRYAELTEKINPTDVAAVLPVLEQNAVRSLHLNPDQEALFDRARRLVLTRKLLNFSLTPAEWNEYQTANPLARLASSESLENFSRFYELAEKRNDAFVRNYEKAQCSIVVVGGFHSEGVGRLLKRSGATVVTLTPRVTHPEIAEGARYLKSFLGDNVRMPTVAATPRLFLALPEALGAPSAPLVRVPLRVAVRQRFEKLFEKKTGLSWNQFKTEASFVLHRSHRASGLTVAIDILDVGTRIDGTTIAYRFNFLRLLTLLPLFALLSFSDIYLYGGLYKMSSLSPKVHTVPDTGEYFLSSLTAEQKKISDPSKLPDNFCFVQVKNYDTKKDVIEPEHVVIRNTYPNAFSVIDMTKINPALAFGPNALKRPLLRRIAAFVASLQFRALVWTARFFGLTITTDFFIWLAPDAITKDNYQWTFYHELADLYQPQEGIDWQARWEEVAATPSRYDSFVTDLYVEFERRAAEASGWHYKINRTEYAVVFVREVIEPNMPPVLRPLLVRHLEGANKDQILPNLFHPEVQEYARRILRTQIRNGVRHLRLDLGHLLLAKAMLPQVYAHPLSARLSDVASDPEPLVTLLSDAKAEANGKLDYVIETYGEENIREFEQMRAPGDSRPLVRTYMKEFYDHFLQRNWDGMRGLLDHALWQGNRFNFADNFDEPSIRQMTGEGPETVHMRESYLRRLLFYAMLGLPSMIDLRTLLDFVGQFFAIVGKNHPSVTPAEFRQWRSIPLWTLILRSPISELLRNYRLRALLSDRQDVDNENRLRFWTMAGRTKSGDWVVYVDDHGFGTVESFTFAVPAGVFDGVKSPFSPEKRGEGRLDPSALRSQIRFLRDNVVVTDVENNRVVWEPVLNETWGVPLMKLRVPLGHGEHRFTLSLKSEPRPSPIFLQKIRRVLRAA